MRKVLYSIVVLGILFLIYLFTWGQGIMVSKTSAIKALENDGFSNITILKKQWHFINIRGGSDGDDVRFTAEATNPAGKKVTVYVFSGWPWKAASIKSP